MTVTAMNIRDAIVKGELSALEVVQDKLDHIQSTNASFNAFTEVTRDRALAEAKSIDALRQAGEPLPPLAGVPYAVKNLFDIEGVVTLAGSKINRDNAPAAADAFLVERMKAAGGVLLGALNMDEYAYGFTTENSHYGPARNPHDTARSAGGSSGGSGAAVAADQVPVALGSDTNGSIRVPSSLCGVWGLKPTFGRLSRRGSYPFVHSIDHLGPFASDLLSLAYTYDALQSPDPHDPACHALRVQPCLPSLQQGVAGLRVGILTDYFDTYASPPARAAAQLAAKLLGATDEVHWPSPAQARAAAFIITASEGSNLHAHNLKTRPQDFEPVSVDRFLSGLMQPATWYVQAQRFRRMYRDQVNELFANWDVLIAPATPVPAPQIGAEWIDINGLRHPCRPALGLLTQPISFAGCPVVAAPMWPDNTGGLPLGVQIIAAPWREDLALRAAAVLEDSGYATVKAHYAGQL